MAALFPILLIGCFALLITAGWMQQRAVDRWAQSSGRAQAMPKSGRSWAAYMRYSKHEMPASLLRQIAIWRWVGYSAIVMFLILALSLGSHER
jgi:hypothetical protein